MASVPLDVQILVIEWVYRSSQHARIDYATLCACALVCRATPIAQQLLFRRILRNPLGDHYHEPPLLIRTFYARPSLAAHVRHIQVGWPMRISSFDDAILDLLELCPHVQGISFLSLMSTRSLSPELEARLRSIPLRPVVLEMIGQQPPVSNILQMWPGVRVLMLSVPDARSLPVRVPSSVQALTLLAGDDVRRCLSPSEPLPELHNLMLLSPVWSNAAWCAHLLAVGVLPQMRILRIRGEFPPQDVLQQLTRLESLVVQEPPLQAVTLPSPLQHFGYHCAPSGPTKLARAEFVAHALRALSDLRLVTVTRSVARDMHAALQCMCRRRGVDFATYETPECFPRPRNIDWI
ncbi:hypothetical protein FA95DRAFT_1557453 [Auriscalpium vulgare]|uniref:Uncharacterized protein n=1 Tax=Auriscalpium vulgare TaxID=40419 RepID=A0ACB8RZ93_9AGAM|nr:hypothetical protein FA95DRAFT_1557453 [Auriscalpium vulgare]